MRVHLWIPVGTCACDDGDDAADGGDVSFVEEEYELQHTPDDDL